MKLEAQSLVKTYRGRNVVDGASFSVNQGEIVGLLGPNGAGKTTSFYSVVGLVRPNEGRVLLDGQDITGLPMYRRAQLGIGYLAQEASVFRKLSVEDNIAAVLEWRGFSRAEVALRTEELLSEFSLHKVRKNRGDLLSGVDPIAVEDIQSIVARLADERGIGVLITDHNVHETLAITDRTYLMFEGKIIKSGTAEELAADDVVRRVYLGQNFSLRRGVRRDGGGR
jgi:lipopolysaccharide export system ATP-binding protein